MSLRIYSSPWAAFSGEAGSPLDQEVITLPKSGVMPRLVGLCPEGLTWNGSAPIRAAVGGSPREGQWDFPLPTAAGDQSLHRVHVSSGLGRVQIHGLPRRVAEADRDENSRERWLVWQLQRYAELSELDQQVQDTIGLEARTRHGARRTWKAVDKYWRLSGDESAELALVVRLAKKERLLQAMRAIERGPRKMLTRKHVPQKLARIQEMDLTTLRVYSRAPGNSAAQKAGSRQELLAVVREDTVDLAENRIVIWVAQRLERMAAAYCLRNVKFRNTTRHLAVRRLHWLCRQLRQSPRLEDVGALPHHLPAPTYCLQFEPRYRQIWKAYCLIRRQDRLEDDAWRWHPHLWGTTARLLTGAMLLGLDGWSETRVSTPYFRTEGFCGRWVDGPSVPGPLQTPFGVCDIVDLRDPLAEIQVDHLGIPAAALSSGADWILAWREARRVVLLWAAVAAGDGRCELITGTLSSRLQQEEAHGDWHWGGLLMIAEPSVEVQRPDWVEARPKLTVLWVPDNVHSRWEDVQVGLLLSLEELHSD